MLRVNTFAQATFVLDSMRILYYADIDREVYDGLVENGPYLQYFCKFSNESDSAFFISPHEFCTKLKFYLDGDEVTCEIHNSLYLILNTLLGWQNTPISFEGGQENSFVVSFPVREFCCFQGRYRPESLLRILPSCKVVFSYNSQCWTLPPPSKVILVE